MSESQKHDAVNHPSHYCREGSMECIDEMILLFGKEEVKSFCKLNAWKYRKRNPVYIRRNRVKQHGVNRNGACKQARRKPHHHFLRGTCIDLQHDSVLRRTWIPRNVSAGGSQRTCLFRRAPRGDL